MKNNKIRLLKEILFISLIMTSSNTVQSFTPVFEWTKKFQSGEELEIKVNVYDTSFVFLHNQNTIIDETTFNGLIGNKIPPAQLKILSDGKLVVKYEINKLLRLESTLQGNKEVKWEKIDFIPIKSYNLKDWSKFIRQAIPRGLSDYEITEYQGTQFVYLTFKRIGPSSIQFGNRFIKFSDKMFEYMRISKEFKPRTYDAYNFVILVHEPHWLLAGQYQLIKGLKSLIETNTQLKFRFLVEGYFEEENKNIPTRPILNKFSKNISKNTQVLTLLRNFLIDGPFAYRLLYDPDLPSIAIDAPEIIKNTPREPDYIDQLEHYNVFIEIENKLNKISKDKNKEALNTLHILSLYIQADVQDLKGQSSIDHYNELAQLYEELIKQLKSFKKQEFLSECLFLEKQANTCHTEVKIFKLALERDASMSRNIADHFKSKYAELIPIAFIGNFHTPGIIKSLLKEIGYVVVEPQLSPVFVASTRLERNSFNNALNPESRLSYLKKLASILKLQVAPMDRELSYYGSFLNKESLKIKSNRDIFISSSPIGADILTKINNILEINGHLNNAQVSFAGRGQIPPIAGAFASFSFDPDGKNPIIIFYDRNKDNWNRSDRLRYLENILFIPPYEKYQKETRKVSFYQDKITNRLFCCLFDPGTLKFYLFEGNVTDIFKLLVPSKGKEGKETQIHLRLSIQEIKNQVKEEQNG